MADDVAKFGVDLDTGAVESNATSAAAALQRLDKQIAEDTQSIAAMQRALKNLQGGSAVNIQQFKQLKERLDAKKNAVAQAQSKYLELGGTFKKLKKPAAEATGGIESLLDKAKGAGGPLGQMAGRFSGLKPLLAAGPWLGLAAAIAAVTVGVIAGAAALTAFGISAANAYRNEKLMLDGLVAMPNWFGRAAGKADELQAAISKVAANNPLARSELGGLSSELYRAGLRGDGLTMALEGVATAQAGGGAQAAEYYKSLVMGAGRSSAAIKRFSDDAKARFGGIVSKKMLDLNVQMSKLRENIDQLFTGLKIEPLLKALGSVTELFSQNTATGKALKTIVESLLQPIVDAVGRTGPIAKRFFQGLVIAALDLTIAILRVRLWFKKTFGDSEILRGIDMTKVALYAGAAAFGALTAAAVVAGAVIAGSMLIAAAPFIVFGATVYGVIKAVYAIGDAVKAIGAKILGTSWLAAGSNIAGTLISGLTLGISNGTNPVINAIKGLGTSAKNALKQVWDAHSPSKAFERTGDTAPQGVVVAFKKGRRSVENASRDLGQAGHEGFENAFATAPALGPARAGASSGAPAAAKSAAPAGGFHWSGDLIYQSHGEKKPEEEVREMGDMLVKAFTGVAIAIGADLRSDAA